MLFTNHPGHSQQSHTLSAAPAPAATTGPGPTPGAHLQGLTHSHAVLQQLHALVQQHKDGVLSGNLPSVVGATASTPPTLVSIKPGAMPPTSSQLSLANISIQPTPTSSLASPSTQMPLSSFTLQPPSTSLSTITTPVTFISTAMTTPDSYTFTSNVNTISIPNINTSTIQDLTVKTRLINNDDSKISSSGHSSPKSDSYLKIKEDIYSNSAKDKNNYQDSKLYIDENSHIINGKSPTTTKKIISKDYDSSLNEDNLIRVWETHGAPVCQNNNNNINNNNNKSMLSPIISPAKVQNVVLQTKYKASQHEISESQQIERQNFANIDTLKQGINSDEAINLSKTSLNIPQSFEAPISPNPLAHLVGDQCSRTTPGLLQAYAESRSPRSNTTSTTTAAISVSTTTKSTTVLPCESTAITTTTSTPPPIVALTQLTVPRVAPPTSAATGDMSKLRKTKLEERTQASITATNGIPIGIAVGRQRQETRNTEESPQGPVQTIPVVSTAPIISAVSTGGLPTIPTIPSMTVAPSTTTALPTHWSLPPTPCTPGMPTSPFWLTQNQYTGLGVEGGVAGGLGMGYQFARDPITGHLLLLGQYPHPLPDPGGHGLVWAGYGSMAATPPVVMGPQQLLLPDTHYHRALQANPALLQIPHPSTIHSSQQTPTKVKQEGPPTPGPLDDDTKSRPISLTPASPSQVVTAQVSPDIPMTSPLAAAAAAAAALRHLPPPFLFPPQSTIPYFCSQSPHARPFPLSAYPHSAATVTSTAATSLSTVAITSATSTYTNTTTNNNSLSTTFSSIPETPVSSISPKISDCHSASSTITLTPQSEFSEHINVTSQSDDEYDAHHTLQKRQKHFEPSGPPIGSLPLNLCSPQAIPETASLTSQSVLKHSNTQSTTENCNPVQCMPLRIKQEIKEEVPSPSSHSAENNWCIDRTMDTHQIMSRNPKIMVKLEVPLSIKNSGNPEVQYNLSDESPMASIKSSKISSEQNKPSIVTTSVTTDAQDETNVNSYERISTLQSDSSAQQTSDMDLSGLELLSRSVLQHANKLPEDKSHANNLIPCSCQESQSSSIENITLTSNVDLASFAVSSLPPTSESPPPPLLEVPPPPPISLAESPPPPLLYSITSNSPASATNGPSNHLNSTGATTTPTITTTTTTAATATTSTTSTTDLPTPTSGLSGLSLLCALAEQRILEEEKEEQVACPALSSLADVAAASSFSTSSSIPDSYNAFQHYQQQSSLANNTSALFIQTNLDSNLDTEQATSYRSRGMISDSLLMAASEMTYSQAIPSFSPTQPKSVDINRNYKSPQSEREAKAFIANKASQYQKEGSFNFKIPSGFPEDSINQTELEMRIRLAELQRKYRETQRELSRLQPKMKMVSSLKRGPGRPPKRKIQNNGGAGKKKVGRPPNKKKRSLQKELSPPILERVTDLEIKNLTKDSDDDRDDTGSESRSILKPPVLTATFTNYRESSSFSNSSSTTFMTQISTEKEESSDEDSSIKMRRWSFSSEDTTPPVLISPFKLPTATKEPRLEESEEEPSKDHLSDSSGSQSKILHTETSVESSPSDMELHSVSSSSKKRKVGRPKKHSPSKEDATETIVAKKPKTLSFLLQNRPLLSSKTKIKPKLKAEVKVRGEEEDEDESPSNIAYNKMNSPDSDTKEVSEDEDDDDKIPKFQICPRVNSESRGRKRGIPRGRTSFSRRAMLRDKEKRKFAAENQSHMEALFRSLKKHSKMACAEHDESDDESEIDDDQDDKDSEAGFVGFEDAPRLSPCPISAVVAAAAAAAATEEDNILQGHTSASDNEETVDYPESFTTIIPTSNPLKFIASKSPPVTTATSTTPIRELSPTFEAPSPKEFGNNSENITPKSSTQNTEGSVCTVDQSDLDAGARVLTLQDGLLYAGHVVPITAPDIYGVLVDGERGSRPHVYCREELLQNSWKEVKPGSSRYLPEGLRVCAFWSQQYRGLYPGCIAASSSPSHETNHNFVNVEFDDGDSGKIHVDDIRLLPSDFPVIDYDPNPLMTLNKRKRRPTADSSAERKSTCSSTNRKKRTISGCENLLGNNEENIHPQHLHANNNIEKENQDSKTFNIKEEKKEDKRDSKTVNKKEEKKKNKKYKKCPKSHHHKHHHNSSRNCKRRTSVEGLKQPHIEPGDSEFSMRIVSPPPPTGENKRTSTKESVKVKIERKEIKAQESSESDSEDEDVASEESVSEEESEDDYTPSSRRRSKSTSPARSRKKRRHPSGKSKIAPFLLERQLWGWSGKGFKRPGAKGKGKKEFFKAIVRGKEMIRVGDCAVFLSAGQTDRPYIGRIELMWESWGGNMVVKVKWFYHPQETTGLGNRLSEHRGALFQSPHTDENDVQTISHKCDVIALSDYKVRRTNLEKDHGMNYENYDLYYLAGFYDPGSGHITMEPGVS